MTPNDSPRQDSRHEFDLGGRSGFSRRALLKSMAAAPLCTGFMGFSSARGAGVLEHWGAAAVKAYLERLSRPDNGYAWDDQATSHLTPTFAVIGCYQLLGEEPPAKDKLAEFVASHHPFHLKKLERDLKVYEFQQIQSLLWLGEDVSSFRDQVQPGSVPRSTPSSTKSTAIRFSDSS